MTVYSSSDNSSHAFPNREPLSADQLDAFARSGWVAAPSFFDDKTISNLLRWTNELAAMPEIPGRSMVYHEQSLINPEARVVQRIENFCPHHADFDALVRSGLLIAAVSQVLGGQACLFKDKINFKMAGGAGFEPHQDQQAGWSRYAPLFVTALVCLDRATEENGCLEMANIPRLDHLIAPEWRPINKDEMSGFEFDFRAYGAG